jgi:hypothetical protein
MQKNATKCNKTLSKWCKNKHEASKIIDTFKTYQVAAAELQNSFSKITDRFRVSIPRLYIGKEAASEVDQGHLSIGPRGPGGAPPHGEPALWALSGSRSVLVLRPGKIGVSVFVSSNSENISSIAFLKHKNSRKWGTGTVASYQ